MPSTGTVTDSAISATLLRPGRCKESKTAGSGAKPTAHSLFYREVEAVERLEELVAREVAGGDGADDLFNLRGDDVALEKLLVVEDLAEDAFGEQVLDEHFADGIVGELGVDGLAAECGKGREVVAEGGVLCELPFEDGGYAPGEVGDLFGEAGDGFFPVDLVRLFVLEEELEDGDEIFRVGDGVVEDDSLALVEDGAAGGLEEDVGERVAGVAFARDFLREVIVVVLGLPEAVDEGEVVGQGAVGAKRLLVL